MRLLRFGLVAATCCGALVLSGCPDKPAAVPDSGVAEAPQAPAPPPPTRFSLSYQALPDAPVAAAANDAGVADDAGVAIAGLKEIAAAPDDVSVIEPTTLLELRTTRPLKNYRVRLFDEADRAMVSDDDVEESEAGLVYRIQLPQPLKSGFKYTLVVEAQTGTAFTDGLGRDVDEFRQALQIAGEKEKPAPPPKPAGKKKRR
ncbi:hypothetical protein HV824_26140 [Myxococcus sp. AM009]|uniref:hypothetical protein n=1 Tax=unclassified Myxococcus TaxID=2648731 RepID=UPI0015951579|nr:MULTISPECIES: hypothetical protein [unclassified Myxococcus]NVJ01575.1 hypothetical protein [Myxococcus sp. AM009]NVJ18236.1 hypothetical protein [Myxococcus sp. AM010]